MNLPDIMIGGATLLVNISLKIIFNWLDFNFKYCKNA